MATLPMLDSLNLTKYPLNVVCKKEYLLQFSQKMIIQYGCLVTSLDQKNNLDFKIFIYIIHKM